MSTPRLDFVIVGAQKAGTTWLESVLVASRSIWMPDREVSHFRDPEFESSHWRLPHLEPGLLAGIRHPSYLARREVPARLHTHNPEVKLIVVLREPVERAVSAYLHCVRHAQVPLLHPNEGLRRILRAPDSHPKYREILEFGLYANHLSRYADVFDSANILILDFTSLVDGRDLERVQSFLGLTDPLVAQGAVNVGKYDWVRAVIDYAHAMVMNEFDDRRSIVARRSDEYATALDDNVKLVRKAASQLPVHVDDAVVAELGTYYKPSLEALSRMRKLAIPLVPWLRQPAT